MPDISSEELMLNCQRGDHKSFDALMQRHEGRLIAYLEDKLSYRTLFDEPSHGDRARAKDLAQEAFLRAFNARARYVPSAKFTTWLYHIALNLYRDEMRKRARRPTVSISAEFSYEDDEGQVDSYELHETIPDQTIPSPEAIVERSEREELIRSALERLRPRQREVLQLRYHHGLGYAEIATLLNCPVGTVQSRIHYASKALQSKIKAESG